MNFNTFLCYEIDGAGAPITEDSEGGDIDPFEVFAYSVPAVNNGYGMHDLRYCFPNFMPGSLVPVQTMTFWMNPLDQLITGIFAVGIFQAAGAPALYRDEPPGPGVG